MPALIASVIAWIVSKIGAKSFMMIFQAAYIFIAISSFVFIVSSLIQAYNMVSELIQFLNSNTSSDSVFLKFWGLLHCVGFVDAVQASKPMFFSSISVLFFALLYKVTLNIHKRLIKSVYNLVSV